MEENMQKTDNGSNFLQNGGFAAQDDGKKSKNKKVLIIVAVLIVAAIAGIFLLMPLIQRSKITGRYYSYVERNGKISYLGEDYYIELMSDGTCLYEGVEGTYTYKSGNLTMSISALGMVIRYTGTVDGDLIALNETSLFGPSKTTYYKKADSFPG